MFFFFSKTKYMLYTKIKSCENLIFQIVLALFFQFLLLRGLRCHASLCGNLAMNTEKSRKIYVQHKVQSDLLIGPHFVGTCISKSCLHTTNEIYCFYQRMQIMNNKPKTHRLKLCHGNFFELKVDKMKRTRMFIESM